MLVAGGWWLTPYPYTPRMRRWTLHILLCLILGAITTVAVAWGLAWLDRDDWAFSEERELDRTSAGARVENWLETYGRIDSDECDWLTGRWRVGDGSDVIEIGYLVPDSPMDSLTIQTAGWPKRCMDGGTHWDFDYETEFAGEEVQWIARFPTTAIVLDGLPLRPIWPGFVIDTVFYAAIWFGVFFGFTSGKRFLRAKRGRCPRCGYDLRGQKVEQVSDLRGSLRLSESQGSPARRAGETGHGSESRATRSRATTGCPECGWNRKENVHETAH